MLHGHREEGQYPTNENRFLELRHILPYRLCTTPFPHPLVLEYVYLLPKRCVKEEWSKHPLPIEQDVLAVVLAFLSIPDYLFLDPVMNDVSDSYGNHMQRVIGCHGTNLNTDDQENEEEETYDKRSDHSTEKHLGTCILCFGNGNGHT